jgi:hypothetical protein
VAEGRLVRLIPRRTVRVSAAGHSERDRVETHPAGGSNPFRMIANTADQIGDGLTAFVLPDTQTTQGRPRTEPAPSARASRVDARVRTTPEDLNSICSCRC